MRSYHHNVRSHVKLPARRARNPLTHIHVGDAKSIDVLRLSGKTILHPLKENSIETSWVVMPGAGWWTRQVYSLLPLRRIRNSPPLLAG